MATQVKSVFLYGKPTKTKRLELIKMQDMYKNHINFFIKELISDKKYYLNILNNNKKSPQIRELEKANRTELGSALGQNAIDHAIKELHNHFVRIKNYLYGVTIDTDMNYFISSTTLLNTSIQGLSCDEVKTLIQGLTIKINSKEKLNKNDVEQVVFYEKILNLLKSYTDEEFLSMTKKINHMFFDELKSRKLPTLNKVSIQLDSRLYTIEEAKDIKANFVLSVKSLERGKRIEIPITTSRNGLRRLNQYGMKSASITINDNGVKVTIPFEKKIKSKSSKGNLIGIDAGITDLLYDSNGNSYGKYSKVIDFYNEKVIPEDAKQNKLKSLMKKYQKELKSKTTHPIRKEFLRVKICNINTMIQQNKKASRTRRAYKHMQVSEISGAIKGYMSSIKGTDATTVIEDLDITVFNRGKKNNRRDSLWVRGQLHKKLEELLAWNGFDVIKVDPAYTSKLCPICSNIHNDNRKYKGFKCTKCGHIDDADSNASINIKNRAFDTEITNIVEKYKYNTKKRHTAIKELYAKRYEIYIKTVA